jgi:hypothetical protein
MSINDEDFRSKTVLSRIAAETIHRIHATEKRLPLPSAVPVENSMDIAAASQSYMKHSVRYSRLVSSAADNSARNFDSCVFPRV